MANQIETIINVQLENRDKKTVFWRGILVAPMIALETFGFCNTQAIAS